MPNPPTPQPDATSLNVAIVIEHFSLVGGGNERSTAQIAERLIERGHAVTIITGGCKHEHYLPGATMRVWSRYKSARVWRLGWFAWWARRELQRGSFDVTLSMTTAVAADVIEARAGTMKEMLKRNVATRPTHVRRAIKRLLLWLTPKHQLFLFLERLTFKSDRLHTAVALSGYVQRQFVEYYQLEPERIRLIPNGSHMPRIEPDQRATWRRQIREAFQVKADTCVFLFASHDLRRKGWATVLQALKRLHTQGEDAVVFLAGTAGYREHRAVCELGLRDHVRFIGPTNQMPAMFAAADVTVLPTFCDPSSKVVIESLMMGTPAISTAYNGASDFILPEEGPTRGRVISDPADSEALAQAMAELIEPETREGCREACDGLDQTLSMDRHVETLIDLLHEAAGQPREAAVASTEAPAGV